MLIVYTGRSVVVCFIVCFFVVSRNSVLTYCNRDVGKLLDLIFIQFMMRMFNTVCLWQKQCTDMHHTNLHYYLICSFLFYVYGELVFKQLHGFNRAMNEDDSPLFVGFRWTKLRKHLLYCFSHTP